MLLLTSARLIRAADTPAAKPRPDARFGNVLFKTPDPDKWQRIEKDKKLIFAAEAPSGGFCTITISPAHDLEGEFQKSFDAAVAGQLKNHAFTRIERDGGIQLAKATEGFDVLQRLMICQSKDGHSYHWFLAGHSGSQFDLLAFETSSENLFNDHKQEAADFLYSVKLYNSLGPAAVAALPESLRDKSAAAEQSVKTPPQPDKAAAAQSPEAPAAQGEFNDLKFAIPDPKVWKANARDDRLVFQTALPAPDFCTITVFSSRELPGDSEAFSKEFAAAIDSELKAMGVAKIEQDSGAKSSATRSGGEMLTRRIYAQAKDFHTRHLFLGIHTGGRMELVAYQTSGQESYDLHKTEAQQFLQSLRVEFSRSVSEPAKPAKPPPATRELASSGSGAATPPAQKGDVQLSGLYMQIQSWFLNGSLSLEYRHYYFFPDGHLFFGIPPGGTVKADPTPADFAALQLLSPRGCGTYRVSKDQITIQVANEKPQVMKFALEKAGDANVVLLDTLGAIKVGRFKDDQKLDARYEGGASSRSDPGSSGPKSSVSASSTLEFHPDGSVNRGNASSFSSDSNRSAVSGGGTSASRGTYKLSGNTLALTLDGKTQSMTAYPYPEKNEFPPRHLFIGGTMYKLEPK
jgi:hypothetical protein